MGPIGVLLATVIVWPIQTKRWMKTLAVGTSAILFCAALFALDAWTRSVTQKHIFHVIAQVVAFNSKSPNQLIANVYIQNDGEDADIAITSESGIARSTADDEELATVIEDLRSKVPARGSLVFRVRTHEAVWFTIEGPNLSDDSKIKFLQGEYTFYFAGKISIKDAQPVDFCSFVAGNNLNAIVECPSPRPKKS